MDDVLSDYGGDVVAARDALVAGSQGIVDSIDEYKTTARTQAERELGRYEGYQHTLREYKDLSPEQVRAAIEMKGTAMITYQARGYHLDRLNSNMQVIGQLDQLIDQGVSNYDPVLHPTSCVRTDGTNYREIKVQYDPRSGEVYESDSLHYGPNILSWGRMHDAHIEFDELPPEFLFDAGYKDIVPQEGYRIWDGEEWRFPTSEEEDIWNEFHDRHTIDAFNLDEAQSKWFQKAAGIRK